MADFFTIEGVPFYVTDVVENTPVQSGEPVRAYDLTARTTVDNTKRSWTVTLDEMGSDKYELLYELCRYAEALDIGGFGFPASLTARVTITGAPFLRDKANFLRVATLNVEEA